ncbi:MAG: serine hydrolase domain-containing protein [Pseudomonadota bacterium]
MKTNTINKRLDEIFQPWNKSDAPGLIVGVASKGLAIYRRGFGLASIEHATANTPQTRMRIGSTSKHFASLSALLLAEQGKLDIDAAVRTYLPELKGVAGDPTLREMMLHTSGLRDPYDLPGLFLHRAFAHMVSDGAGLELSQRFNSTNYAPGERMVYCNNGYHLLSKVVERISGESFGAFLRNHILDPLGMADTELLMSDMRIIPGIATLHLPQADGSYVRGIYPSGELLGSGGMVSSIDDMLKWLVHLRGEKKVVGSKRSWKQMLEKPRYTSGATGDYCLGLTREFYRGVEIIHHAGAVLGGTCQMLTVPEHALDIVIMCNRMDGSAPALALKVIDALLDKSVLEAPNNPLPAKKWKALHGQWYSPRSHRVFGVQAHPQAGNPEPVLALSIHNAVSGVLKKSGNRLAINNPGHGVVELHLPKTIGKNLKALDFSDSGHRERFIRLPQKVTNAQQVFKGLIGRYRYDDFDTEVAITLEDGTFYLDLLPSYGKSRFKLEAWSDEVFGGSLTGTSFIPLPANVTLAIERKAGKVTGLWLNNLRTRNLWLERCG